jgi:hypothetical protein
MAELSLTALQDTVIKRFTIDSTDIDNPGEKFDLEKFKRRYWVHFPFENGCTVDCIWSRAMT